MTNVKSVVTKLTSEELDILFNYFLTEFANYLEGEESANLVDIGWYFDKTNPVFGLNKKYNELKNRFNEKVIDERKSQDTLHSILNYIDDINNCKRSY
jgi:CheY-specific phosphatase CheX